MPKLPGINHQRAVKAFEKAGFWITRQRKHITMTAVAIMVVAIIQLARVTLVN